MTHLPAGPFLLAALFMMSLVLTGCVTTGSSSADSASEPVLRHVVIFKFKESATPEQIEQIVADFAALPEQIDAIIDFEHGVNNSPEGLDNGFTHVFLVTFASEQGRAAYLPHPAHKAFVEKLLPLLEEPMVLDYWTQ